MNMIVRILAVIGFALTLATPRALAQNSRLKAVISDTHWGVGRQADGNWHPYEDARWASEFALFLNELSRQGNTATDLVLNGDTFELWQSLLNDCTNADKDLGCTEADALNRLKVVVAAHRSELDALHTFATKGSNTVSIVPGNHDAALTFPAVAAEVLKAIGAPADRVRILPDGYWTSPDGLILAEHGHQIGSDVNKFSLWPKPFVDKDGNTYLQRPWGEKLVRDFYNQFEFKYPIIDNMESDSTAIKYGLIAELGVNVVKDIGKFLRFYLTQTSYAQLLQTLGGQKKGPQWDVAAIRSGGDKFFVESLLSDDPLRPVAEKALNEHVLGVSLTELSDDEILGICNMRAAVAADDEKMKKPPRVRPCPQRTLGAAAVLSLSLRDHIFRSYLDAASTRLRAAGVIRQPFELFIYSHTHVVETKYEPLEKTNSQWRPVVMNTGAWQRTISEEKFRQLMQQRNLKVADALMLPPEDLPPCYPVVLVKPYDKTPTGLLRYWRWSGNAWSLGEHCG